MRQRNINCVELAPGEADDGTKRVLHRFTVGEAEQLQAFLEAATPDQATKQAQALLNRAAIAFAHAAVIEIG